MKSLSVARYLSDFSIQAEPARRRLTAADLLPEDEVAGFEAGVSVIEPAMLGTSDAEVDSGPTAEDVFEAGRRAGLEEMQAELEAQRERFEQERRDAAASLETELGAKVAGELAGRMDAALDAAAGELSAILTRLIRPLVARRAEARAVDAFAHRVSALATEAKAASVEVRGPERLLSALRDDERLASAKVCFVEAAQPEVTARIDERLFETRLSPILQELEEILA